MVEAVSAPRDLSKIYTSTYVVQPGDSLLKVSMMFKVNRAELIKVNNIFGENLFPNDVLKVPEIQVEVEEVVNGPEQSSRSSSLCDALDEMNIDEGDQSSALTRNAVISLNDPKLIQELQSIEIPQQQPETKRKKETSFRLQERESYQGAQKTLTDPATSYESVQNHFAKI